jgi:c-di-GMP-binding flagellar brake protein YcgR
MQPSTEIERRRCQRFEVSFNVTAQEVLSFTNRDDLPISMRSQSRNLSNTGMCLLLDRACTAFSLLRCDVFLPGSRASIPTLARVRWIQNHQSEESVAGVEFLF